MNTVRNLVLAGASFVAMSVPAIAQEAPVEAAVDAAGGGDEIIVQARRKDESIQDVPLSMQAVTGQELQKLEIRQFEDVTKVVPGLSLSKTGSSTSASLRGIAFNATASGSATSVEFYRNDAVTTGGALFQAVYDIGQVEVLRGPQGTLRGRASPSGSITVTTRRPDLSEVGGYVSGTASDQRRWNFNGALNVPVIGDKLAVRVAGFVGSNRGNNVFGLNVPLNTIDSDVYERTRALRASVRADPFDGILVLDFNYETIRTSSRRFNQVQSLSTFSDSTLPADQSPRVIGPEDRLGVGAMAATQESQIKIYNWQAVARQWGQRLTYVGSRQRLSLVNHVPGDDAGIFGTSTAQVTQPNFAPINFFGQYTGTEITQMTHELRLQNEDRLFGMFDYVVGAFRATGLTPTTLATPNTPNVTATAHPNLGTAYQLNGFSYTGRGRYSSVKESSLFGNLTLHLGNHTEISGGLRHIWYSANSGLIVGNFGTSANPSTPYQNGTDVASIRRCFGFTGCGPAREATIYAASIKHNFTRDLMAYFSFGTSWRPGNSLVGYQGATTSPLLVNYLNLPDEKSKSFEIGIKSAWLDNRLRFNVSAYYQKFNNYPLSSAAINTVLLVDPDGNDPLPAAPTLINTFAFASPVDVTVKGFEADLVFDVSRNFNIAATVAFADSKVSGGRVVCVDLDNNNIQDTGIIDPVAYYNQVGADQVDTCSVNGQSASNLPRWSGTIQAEYSQPIGFGEAFVRGFMTWKGESAGNAVNPNDSVSAHTLVDLFTGIRAENGAWELSAFVKNLFDTKRVLTRDAGPLTTNTNAGARTYNYLGIATTDPREVGISLRYAFGSR